MNIKFLAADENIISGVMLSHYRLHEDQYSVEKNDNFITVNVSGENTMDAGMEISVENEGLIALLTLFPALGGGTPLTLDDVKQGLLDEGVVFNLDEKVIAESFSLYSQDVVVHKAQVATGAEMFPGKDAVITLNFNATYNKPKVGEDGRVDFKNLDNIIQAKKGDVLISKRPATLGIKGVSVKNSEILPHAGKDIIIICGEGVSMNPVGTSYIATHDGYVEFKDNYLAVHEVYFVNNVDFSTGNIKFSGTVHVKGDVLSGFKVEADKDVFIEGICGDCEITAKKSLHVKTGIKGNGANLFRAGENFIVGYCEKAKIFAKKDIIIKKYSYNCELYSGETIDASSEEGIIAGGLVKAYSLVNVNQLGTQGNSKFTVYMGTKYHLDHALDRIRRQKAGLTEVLGQINDLLGQLDLSDKAVSENQKVIRLMGIKKGFEKTIMEMSSKEDFLMKESRADNPKVKVKGTVYEGVTVMFFNCSATIREKQENMVYYLDQKYSEVAWVSLKDAKNVELDK